MAGNERMSFTWRTAGLCRQLPVPSTGKIHPKVDIHFDARLVRRKLITSPFFVQREPFTLGLEIQKPLQELG